MSVTLSPSSQLAFQRPLTQLVKRTLAVSNHNSQPIVYKVKTTAPKQYCVRPNSGRIEPGETVEVQVLLQPMKEDPAPGAKCRDKFLVQSVIVTMDRESSSLAELWAQVEKEDKASSDKPSQIHEQKIRCAYLPAADDGTNGTIQEEESTPYKSSNTRSSSSNGTPSASAITNAGDQSFASTMGSPPSPTPLTKSSDIATSASSSPAASAHESPIPSAAQATAAAGGAVAAAASAIGLAGVASTVAEKTGAEKPAQSSTRDLSSTSTGDKAVDTLRAELQAAKEEIRKLKEQLQSSETTAAGLRSRGVGAGEKAGNEVAGSAQALEHKVKTADGVPVQVVLGIAVGVFVLTWALF